VSPPALVYAVARLVLLTWIFCYTCNKQNKNLNHASNFCLNNAQEINTTLILNKMNK